MKARIKHYFPVFAIAVFVFLLMVFSTATKTSIAWADDKQAVTKIHSVSGMFLSEIISKSNDSEIHLSRCYFKDPGRQRVEVLKVAGDIKYDEITNAADLPVENTFVTVQKDGKITEEQLISFNKTMLRIIQNVSENTKNSSYRHQIKTASSLWEEISKLREKASVELGERMIDGSLAIGYQASVAEDTFILQGIGKGAVNIWIDDKTGLPILIETDKACAYTKFEGYSYRARYSNLVWNAELPDTLFALDTPEGWVSRVYDRTNEIDGFKNTSFQPGVIICTEPKEDQPVISEEDIVSVNYETIAAGNTNQMFHLMYDYKGKLIWFIRLRLKPLAADKLKTLTLQNSQISLSIDFKNRFKIQIPISMVLEDRTLKIPMADCGYSPREFEKNFLFTPELPQQAQGLNRVTELSYRIEFEKAVANDISINEKAGYFIKWLKQALDEPGVLDVLWQSEKQQLVVKIKGDPTAGIDESWIQKEVEKLLKIQHPTLQFLILAPGEYEPEIKKIDLVEAKRKELVPFLKRMGGLDKWRPLDVDLNPLTFKTNYKGKDIRFKWFPISTKMTKELKLPKTPIDKQNEINEMLVSKYFKIAQIYGDKKWNFTSDDLAEVKTTTSPDGTLAIGFEMCDERKDDFFDFTESHFDRQLAIVINGSIWSAPVIKSAIPGNGIISGGAYGFTKEEQAKLLVFLRYPKNVQVSKFEYVETRSYEE